MPGASSMRGVTGFRALDAVNGALAQLDPDRGSAPPARAATRSRCSAPTGPTARGGSSSTSWSSAPGAGRPTATATTALTNPASLAANIPVEVAESEFPIQIERYGLVPDSGGAGRAPRRARGRARLAVPDARDVADRPLRPLRAPALRARRRRAGRALVERPRSVRTGPRRSCPRCSRPRSATATSTSTAWRAAAAGAIRSSASPSGRGRRVDGKVRGGGDGYGVVVGEDGRSTPTTRGSGWQALRRSDRPDHVRGDPQRARRGDRRDGAGAAPERLLDEHQDALRLLVRVLRRRAALGRRRGSRSRCTSGRWSSRCRARSSTTGRRTSAPAT